MKKLSKDTQNNIISLLEQGKSCRTISKELHVGKSSVATIAKTRGITKKKEGRPKKLSQSNINFCTTQISRGKATTTTALVKTLRTKMGIDVHRTTIAKELKKKGLKSGEKKEKPLLSKKKYCSQASLG